MRPAVSAEWTKLRTLSETWWLPGGAIVLAAAASAALSATTHTSPGAPGGGPDPSRLALGGIDLSQAVTAVIAVVAITEEYATGVIRLSLAAIPRRETLLGAKALTIAVVTLAAAAPTAGACLLVGRLLIAAPGSGSAHGQTLAAGAVPRVALGAMLYLALVALMSLGVGAIVRDTAAATGVVLGLLYLPPLLASLTSGSLRRHIEQIAPMTAGLSIEATRHLRSLDDRPWAGLAILAAWAAAALVLGGVSLRVRDA